MTWLITHMWVTLSACAGVALILGWSLRGALLNARVRRAEVERDVVRVELGEARDEIEKLFEAQRKLAVQAPEAERPGLPSPAVGDGQDDLTPPGSDEREAADMALRLAALEAELGAARAEIAGLRDAAASEPATAVQDEFSPRLSWQVAYLRQRVRALEGELLAVPAAQAGPEDGVQEELASLRWRNRYLEGRLAYFEGEKEVASEEVADGAGEPVPAADPEDAAGTPQDTDTIAETVMAVRPLALDRPVDGAADDLTLIGGIGPKIREVLNGLGIFHFDQIADWTPENVAWVDQYLNFNGRILREGWVEQAAILVGEAGDL